MMHLLAFTNVSFFITKTHLDCKYVSPLISLIKCERIHLMDHISNAINCWIELKNFILFCFLLLCLCVCNICMSSHWFRVLYH